MSALRIILLLLHLSSTFAQNKYFVWFLYPEHDYHVPTVAVYDNQRNRKPPPPPPPGHPAYEYEPWTHAKTRRSNEIEDWISPFAAGAATNWDEPKQRNAICEWLEIAGGAVNCRWQCHSHYKPTIAATIQIEIDPASCTEIKRQYSDHTQYYPLTQFNNYIVYINGVLTHPLHHNIPSLLMRPVRDETHKIWLVTSHTSFNSKSFHTQIYLNIDRLWNGGEHQQRDQVNNFDHEHVFTLVERKAVTVAHDLITGGPTDDELDARQSIIIFHRSKAVKAKYYKQRYYHIHSRNMKFHFKNDYSQGRLNDVFDHRLPQLNTFNTQMAVYLGTNQVQTLSIASNWNGGMLNLGLNEATVTWDGPTFDERNSYIQKMDDDKTKIKTAKETRIKQARHAAGLAGESAEAAIERIERRYKRRLKKQEAFKRRTTLETYAAREIGGLQMAHGSLVRRSGKLFSFGSAHGQTYIGKQINDLMEQLHTHGNRINYVLIEIDVQRIRGVRRLENALQTYMTNNHVWPMPAGAGPAANQWRQDAKSWLIRQLDGELKDMLVTYLWALLNEVPIYLVDIKASNFWPFLLWDRAEYLATDRTILNWGTMTYSWIYYGIWLEVRNQFMTTAINGLLKVHYENNHHLPNIWITVGDHHLRISEAEKVKIRADEISRKGVVPYSMRDLLQGKAVVLPAFTQEIANYAVNWDIYRTRVGVHAWDRHLRASAIDTGYSYYIENDNEYQLQSVISEYGLSEQMDLLSEYNESQRTRFKNYGTLMLTLVLICGIVLCTAISLTVGLGGYALATYYDK